MSVYLFNSAWSDDDIAALAARRAAHQARHDEMVAARKLCERQRDIPGARMFSAFAADARQQLAGATLALDWMRGARGSDFPAELKRAAAHEADVVAMGLAA